ncbi:unnamed protein product, partial [Effrenium voratum]
GWGMTRSRLPSYVICAVAVLAWTRDADLRLLFSLRPPHQSEPVDGVLAAGVPASEAEGVRAMQKVVVNRMEPLADPLTLLRFYRARRMIVEEALEMYNVTLDWRAKYSIPRVMDAFGTPGQYREDSGRAGDTAKWSWVPSPNTPEARLALRHAFFERLPAPVPEPVLIWRAGAADYNGMVREDLVDLMVQAFVVHLEASCLHVKCRLGV